MYALKRVYLEAKRSDGFRVLADRLWPRGVSKEKACLDLWLKEIAPSDGLRRWFGHVPEKWDEFRRKYLAELQANPEAVKALQDAVKGRKKITLLYGARDGEHNEAVVLKEFLERKD